MKLLQYLFALCGAVVFYFIFYIIARTVLPVLPVYNLWEGADFIIQIGGHNFPFFDLLFFTAGLLVFCHGSVYLVYVNNYPDSLYDILSKNSMEQVRGPYSKVRHPMYTSFIMIELGLFFSLRSLYPVLFFILLWIIQLTAMFIEENYSLKKKYPDIYKEYTAAVRSRFLNSALAFYFVIAALLVIGGIVIRYIGVEQ